MSDFLAAMTASSRRRAERILNGAGEARLSATVASAKPAVPLQLSDEGFDLISEPKLASPSEGRLASGGEDQALVVELASEMGRSGAAAISVLTEPTAFAGDIRHLERVSARMDVPVMRKDFLVDPIQVLEARAAGASGVLLIGRLTPAPVLADMTDLALELGMFVLVEVFDDTDLDVASSVFDRGVLIGVNARDLATLEVDRARHRRLVSLLPNGRPLVAESGIVDAEDAAEAARLGYSLALVGSGLVSSRGRSALAQEMIRAGRRAVRAKEPS